MKGTSLAAALICLASTGAWHPPSAPDDLAARVTIYRDTYGIPHVFGQTDAATMFGFAYAQAEDNVWRIEDNYIRGLRANLEYTVDYTGESTDKDGNVVVATTINTKRHGRPYKIEVDYVLKKDGDKLKAWDVKTDGVGLVENYRQQFDKIIDKDGFAGLIAKMKKKQAASGG